MTARGDAAPPDGEAGPAGGAGRAAGVVMLAYGDEPYLHDAVRAVLASRDVDLDVVLVDNGCTSDAVRTLPPDPRLRVVRPGRNLGFTGGVDLGATLVPDRPVVLVNSDAIVADDAIGLLLDALAEPDVGVAGALVELAAEPGTVNSAGNPLHVLGLSWAGGLGGPVTAHRSPRDVASASGACLAVRRDVWDTLGGLPDLFFAYMEDLELCWRTWQLGYRVRLVPAARAPHHYEFGRSPLKMYLLERNRGLFVLTAYGPRLLAALALPLLALEAAMLLVAATQGWAGQKVRGWIWTLGHLRDVRRRRRVVQRTRVVPDGDLAGLMTVRFDTAQMPLPAAAAPLESALAAWWRVVRRWV